MSGNDISSMSGRADVIDARVDVKNANELDFIGNAIGGDAIHKKIDKHFDKLLDRVIDNDKNGKIEGMMQNIQTGEGLTAKQHEQLEKIAEALSPDELKTLVERGKISKETADFLVVADALKDAGMTGDAKGRGLSTYLSMTPDAQKYCAETFADRDSHRVVKAETRTGFLGIRDDKVKFKSKEEDLNPAQERMVVFLTANRPQGHDNVQNYMAGNFDTSRDALMSAFSELPTFRKLDAHQQNNLLDYFHHLGVGHGPGGQPVDIKGPDDFKQMGFDHEEVVALATLMYQVMADRVSTLDNQVRSYADGVQKKNDELKTLTNAMAEVREVSKTKGKSNFSEATFTDASGKDVSLSQFLSEQGVASEDKLNSMNPTEVQEMLSSLKEKSDILSSDSSQAMTKLQQVMDKYNQATTMQTNLQSKFNSLDMSIRRNLAG
ncbi:MAG: hypothetical protein AAGC95_01555 [Pseudomonadota bacterium]